MPSSFRPPSLSSLWFSFRPYLLISAFLAASVVVNEEVIRYRMREFYLAMEDLSRKYSTSHTLNMVGRFELIRQRQVLPEEDQTAIEARLQALETGSLVQGQGGETALSTRIVEKTIRFVGFLLGKTPVVRSMPPEGRKEIEIAYVYEKSRRYDEAIEIYSRFLETGPADPQVRATVLLHRAFCISMLGDYEAGIAGFREVARMGAVAEEQAAVSLRLLSMLEDLQKQVLAARAEAKALAAHPSASPVALARKYFQLANYTEAIEKLEGFLEEAEKAAPGPSPAKREAMYLLARAREEIGQTDYAVEQYRELMDENPEGEYAKKANRRLYVLGKFYEEDGKLAQEAMKKIEEYRDYPFVNALKQPVRLTQGARREAVMAASVRLAAVALPASGLEAPALEGSLAEKEGAAALPAPPPPPGKARDLRSAPVRTAIDLAGSAREARAAKARARGPVEKERQEALFQGIENNRGELHFIYQRFLRRGDVFEGNVTVRILVSAEGLVKDARIVGEKSDIDNTAFRAELLQNIRRWKFRPDPEGGLDVPISFPLRFVNQE